MALGLSAWGHGLPGEYAVQHQPFSSDSVSASSHVFPVSLAGTNQSADELSAALNRVEVDLVALHRLAMLGTMSAMLAHEVNNLMTPIEGRAEFALSTKSPEDMRVALEQVMVQVRQIKLVMEHMLDLASAENQAAEPVSAAAAVQQAINTMPRPLEKDRIELNVSVPAELSVSARPGLLEQVLLNLLLNARQAMKPGGGKLSVLAKRDGAHVVIDVRDTGKGIAPERLDGVINPFLAGADQTSPQTWQSVGLGLNVCRAVADKCSATIEGRVNDGRGCTFRLRWPAA